MSCITRCQASRPALVSVKYDYHGRRRRCGFDDQSGVDQLRAARLAWLLQMGMGGERVDRERRENCQSRQGSGHRSSTFRRARHKLRRLLCRSVCLCRRCRRQVSVAPPGAYRAVADLRSLVRRIAQAPGLRAISASTGFVSGCCSQQRQRHSVASNSSGAGDSPAGKQPGERGIGDVQFGGSRGPRSPL